MFEKEIKFIYDFNLNKVNKLGPYFTFEQLQGVDLHPAILQYISAEIDYLVFEDRQKLLKNSVFDYSGEKIVYYFSQISEELKKNKRFSLEYIAKIILHSTSFTVNYLMRPNWTLTRFIFDESKHKTTNEIKQILNYVHYYKYLKKIIVAFINSKKILSMNVEEFEELLEKTDKLGLETNLKGILSNSLVSMAEFLNIGQMQKTRIPLTAVELFLEEKNLPHHVNKLSEVLGNDENARFNIGDYMKVLTKVSIKDKEMPLQEELLFSEKEKSIEEELQVIEPVEEKARETETSKFSNVDIIPSVVGTGDVKVSVDKIIPKLDLDEEENAEANIFEEESIADNETEFRNEDGLKIPPHTKIKIKVNEDNRLEPIDEIEEVESQAMNDEETESVLEENNDFDSYSSLINELKKESENQDELNDEEVELFSKLEEEIEEFKEEETSVEEETVQESEEFEALHSEVDEEKEKLIEEEDLEIEGDTSIKDELETTVDDYEDDEEIVEELKHSGVENKSSSKLDISEILEHKNMTRIIEVVFDYDIEDFANVLDEISNCRNVDDAIYVVHEVLAARKISRNSKEAETLREIITEYFSRK